MESSRESMGQVHMAPHHAIAAAMSVSGARRSSAKPFASYNGLVLPGGVRPHRQLLGREQLSCFFALQKPLPSPKGRRQPELLAMSIVSSDVVVFFILHQGGLRLPAQ